MNNQSDIFNPTFFSGLEQINKMNNEDVIKYNKIQQDLIEIENDILTNVNEIKETQLLLEKMLYEARESFLIISKNCIN